VILVVESVHERFVELLVTARPTIPPKPLREVTLMIEVPITPVSTDTLVEPAITV
jgi:hypothetical protein